MWNEAVLKKHQTLLSWGLLVVLLLALIFMLVIPLLQTTLDYGQRIETGYQQLTRFRQITNATPELTAEFERVQQQGLDKLFYPAGMTSAQVAKELQKHLATVITRDNGVLVSSEVIEDPQTGEQEKASVYQRVMVKAVFQSSPALLREVLHQAYRARPLIFVESIDIKPLDDGGKDSQVIKAEVKISSYWRGGEVSHEEAN
jgi:hypothetical protein